MIIVVYKAYNTPKRRWCTGENDEMKPSKGSVQSFRALQIHRQTETEKSEQSKRGHKARASLTPLNAPTEGQGAEGHLSFLSKLLKASRFHLLTGRKVLAAHRAVLRNTGKRLCNLATGKYSPENTDSRFGVGVGRGKGPFPR